MFFVLFSCNSTCKYVDRTYPVAVYTLKTPSANYLFIYLFIFFNRWKCSINFWCSASAFKTPTVPFVPTSKALNMLDWALFVVCLLVDTLFLLFSGILTCNCISRTYLVAVYALNTPSTPCCLFLTTENVPFIFDAMIWTSKHQPYDFYIFQSSEYVRRYLVCCLFASK